MKYTYCDNETYPRIHSGDTALWRIARKLKLDFTIAGQKWQWLDF
jgi:hypothetical protein